MVPPVANPGDDAYERALRDPPFLEAVRAAHRGGWDVLDALWWAAHPNDAAPSGTAAPLPRVRELQRRVFAADADAVGDPAVTGALRELEREYARERMAIDAAVVAARFAESHGPAVPLLVRAPAAPTELDDTPVTALPGEPAAASAMAGALPTGRRARLRLAGYLSAAVLVGVVIGGQLAGATTRDGAVAPTSSTAAEVDESSVRALAIFDRARNSTDTPGVPVPSSFDRSSLRAVWRVSWDISGPRAEPPYFVARAAGDRVCLLVMVNDARHVSTCVSTVEFAGTGMRLYWMSDTTPTSTATSTSTATDTAGSAARPRSQILLLEWTPAGRFAVEEAASVRRTWQDGLCPTDLPRPC